MNDIQSLGTNSPNSFFVDFSGFRTKFAVGEFGGDARKAKAASGARSNRFAFDGSAALKFANLAGNWNDKRTAKKGSLSFNEFA